MKYILMLALLAPIVYLALRQKKWYLYLLFGLICFLPEQFAVQLHDKLPLISATRLLILLVVGAWLLKCWKEKKLLLPVSILCFLGLNLLISCVNLQHGFDEVNRMFLFIFERTLLVLAVTGLIENRQEVDRCVDFMILGCVAVSVIGIVQIVFEYDIASVLHLVETAASAKVPDRMGLVRAYGTFNAIAFGCYCSIMLLLIYFRLENTKKQYYSAAFAVTFMAMFCTLTRSAWLCFAAIFFLLVVIRKGKPILRLLPSAGIAILLCLSLCLVQPKLYSAIVETGKSTFNTVISVLPPSLRPQRAPANTTDTPTDSPETSEDETKPNDDPYFELDKEFGLNANAPINSRTQQWSAMERMEEDGYLVFGYGYNAYPEGKIFYRRNADSPWQKAHAIDAGVVSLGTESGIVGLATMIAFLGYMFIVSWLRRTRSKEFDYFKMMLYLIPMYGMLNVASSFLHKPVVWLCFALFYACHKLENAPCDKCLRLPLGKQRG